MEVDIYVLLRFAAHVSSVVEVVMLCVCCRPIVFIRPLDLLISVNEILKSALFVG